jgi:hypothetical protein
MKQIMDKCSSQDLEDKYWQGSITPTSFPLWVLLLLVVCVATVLRVLGIL